MSQRIIQYKILRMLGLRNPGYTDTLFLIYDGHAKIQSSERQSGGKHTVRRDFPQEVADGNGRKGVNSVWESLCVRLEMVGISGF